MPPPIVKICGLSTAGTLEAALAAGAEMVGFVHFGKSPRHVGLALGRALSAQAAGRAERVALLVDPDDALAQAVVEALDPEWIQLHGRESPERVAEIRAASGRRVMKAIGVAARADLAAIPAHAAADRILLDAKPPEGAALPGGNGRAFHWDILAGADLPAGWMLSGGLDPHNVARAIARSGARAVDVSSGVETRPGEKDPDKIVALIAAARASV